ncbi:alpha-1,6-glucosidase domain-containing protein, partial [Actinotalea sp. K2]|uniref:alpha-1,6-glucosidase domain-containing protein n=1 Tax=Actinotalea sp. K2 TaxID=2939438 RepID=UPI002016B48A
PMPPLPPPPPHTPAPDPAGGAPPPPADLLRLRFSTDLFRLGDAELIEQKVTFPGSGPDAVPGVIMMHVDDTVGPDVDRSLDGMLVVFNATDTEVTLGVDGLAGADYTLSEVLEQGSDEVVRQTAWDAATGEVTVPARTVTVLVDDQEAPGGGGSWPGPSWLWEWLSSLLRHLFGFLRP